MCRFPTYTTNVVFVGLSQSLGAALTNLISVLESMKTSKLRRRIAWVAARLMYHRKETEFYRAKIKAARHVSSRWVKRSDLPTNAEIREEILALLREDGRAQELFERVHDVETDEHADAKLEEWLCDPVANEASEKSVDRVVSRGRFGDRFAVYESLLLPLEHVMQSRRYHPEGDALYHSLQVFVLAREELPYDEEFLLAALLHDVGKAIDPHDHVNAALESLADIVTVRTAWFIQHHPDGQAILEGTLGVRAGRRLRLSEDYDELLVLSRCDREGRRQGVPVPDVEEALEYVRELDEQFG